MKKMLVLAALLTFAAPVAAEFDGFVVAVRLLSLDLPFEKRVESFYAAGEAACGDNLQDSDGRILHDLLLNKIENLLDLEKRVLTAAFYRGLNSCQSKKLK